MKNWFYTFYNEKSHSQIIGAISTPPLPGITFAMVREQLIRPYLMKQGISNPINLTYERAKNAAKRIPIIEASEITPSININGIKYSTLTGYAEKKPKESVVVASSDKVGSSPVKPKEPIVNDSSDKAERSCYKPNESFQDVSLEELLSDWKQAHKYDSEYETDSNPQIEKDSFVEDGPVNKDIYEKSKIKVLFILKEANVVFDKKVGLNGRYTASRSSIEWINGVIDASGQHELLKTIDGMNKAIHKAVSGEEDASLKQMAYMNLNKRGGAGTSTDLQTFRAYVSRYSDYIRTEITILRPDYVICCGSGTLEMISEIVLKNGQDADFFMMGKTLYIKARHPSYSYMTTQQKIDEFEKQFRNAYFNNQT